MKMNAQLLSVFIVCCTASNTMFAEEMFQNVTRATALALAAGAECIPCIPKPLAALMFDSSSKYLVFQKNQSASSKALVLASHYNITKPQARRNPSASQRKLGNGTCRPRDYQRGNYTHGKPRATKY